MASSLERFWLGIEYDTTNLCYVTEIFNSEDAAKEWVDAAQWQYRFLSEIPITYSGKN